MTGAAREYPPFSGPREFCFNKVAIRKARIENKLAKKYLKDGTLVLFDVSSSFHTGKTSSLIAHGYSRDHCKDRPQIVYGLLCDSESRPIAVEVFPANTSAPKTFTRIDKVVLT